MSRTSGLVIVGSGPAGLATARSYRSSGGDAPVTLLTADSDPPFARPPLTKDYLRGECELDHLWLLAESWFADQGVDLVLADGVIDIDASHRRLLLASGRELGYTDLLLATGSRPKQLPVDGGDAPGLIYVRSRASGDRLREVAEQPGGRVAVIGSGFIGCEAAASLASRGVETVVIAAEDLPNTRRLGPEAGTQLRSRLAEAGVELRAGTSLSGIESIGSAWRLRLHDGATLEVAQVVCGGGVEPRLELAVAAGLRIKHGGVLADARLRSSDPAIRVAGDIAYAHNTAAGRALRVEHWGDAEAHGEIAGTTLAGGEAEWDAPPGFWSTIGNRTLKYSSWGDGWTNLRQRWSRQLGDLRGQDLLARAASFEEAVPIAR